MNSFGAQIAKFAEKTKTDIDVVVRTVTLNVGASLIQQSPVLTGRFRANWMIGLGSPDETTTEDTDANASTGRIAQAVGTAKAGGIIYLTNSLPYANRLELGWSKQAPAGFVAATADTWRQYLNDAVYSVKTA